MTEKGICEKGFIWNTSNCNCTCDKLCDVAEYLDYENCKWRNRLVHELVEECSENIDGNEWFITIIETYLILLRYT